MTVLAVLVAITCVVASVERLRRVRRAIAVDLGSIARALPRDSGAVDLSEMRDLLSAEGASWEGEVLHDVLSVGLDQRAAVVNEHLRDVESQLDWGSRIPLVAARSSAMGALCLLFFGLATRTGVGFTDIVSIVGWGGAGVLGALAAGREADRVATEARRGVDVWVARILEAARERPVT